MKLFGFCTGFAGMIAGLDAEVEDRGLGCTEMQGYLFSPGVLSSELRPFFPSRRERRRGAA